MGRPAKTGQSAPSADSDKASRQPSRVRALALGRHVMLGVALAVLVFAMLIAALVFRPTIAAILSPTTSYAADYTDELDDQGAKLSKSIAAASGTMAMTQYGIAVEAGKRCAFVLKGDKLPGETPFAKLLMYGGDVAVNTVTFSCNGTTETIRVPHSLSPTLYRPTGLDTTGTEYEVEIASMLPAGRGMQGALVLDQLQVGAKQFPRGEFQRDFWTLPPLCLLPLLAGVVALRLSPRPWLPLTAALVVAALVCLGAMLGAAFRGQMAMAAVVLALVAAFSPVGIRGPLPGSRLVEGLGVAALLAVAFWVRWQWFIEYQAWPLLPDAAKYASLADEMSWPYDAGFREPLYICLIWVWNHVVVRGAESLRLLSLCLAMLNGVFLYLLARMIAGRILGLLALALFAVNASMACFAPTGLREDLTSAMCLLFACGCVHGARAGSTPRRQAAIAGGIAGGMLARMNSASVFAPVYAVYALRSRWPWSHVLLAWGVSLLLVAPHIAYNWSKYGDPLYSSNLMVKGFRNMEFAGQPGYPTKEEVSKDLFTGQPVTMGEYLFRLHTRRQVLASVASGTVNLVVGKSVREWVLRFGVRPAVDSFRNDPTIWSSPRWWELAAYSLYLLGLAVSWRYQDAWVCAAVIFLFQLPISYLSGANLLDARTAMAPAAFMLILVVVGLRFLGDTTIWVARSLRAQVEPAKLDKPLKNQGRGRRRLRGEAKGA